MNSKINIKEDIKDFKKHFFTPSILALLSMVILIGMGEKMAERFLPLYLVALGGTAYSVSLLNGMDNLLSALYSFPGGYLSDKLGYKRAMVVFNLMAMMGYTIVILFASWWAVLIGAIFFISWTAISLPSVMSMVSKVIPKTKRTMGVTVHSLVRRLPMAIGPIIGGLFIQFFGLKKGVRIAFGIALCLAFIAILVEWFFIKEPPKSNKKPLHLKDSLININADLRNLLVSDILIRFAEQIPYAFVVIWAVNMNGITPVQFGILTSIEMVTAVIIYIPVAYFADKFSKKPFITITFCFFTAFPFILIFSRSFEMLVIAFIIRGLKEFGEPTRKALIMDLAPENAKASTFGTYYLIRDVIVSIAAFSAAIFWKWGPQYNFIIAGVFGILGTLYFIFFGRDLNLINSEEKSINK